MKKKNKITFVIYGDAKPKSRARTVRNKHTGKVHSFTPKTTEEWESSIYGQALKHKPEQPFEGPIALGVVVFKKMPKSFSQKKKKMALEGTLRPATARGDLDNLIKSIKDGLQDLYWLNDGQVVEYCKVAGLNTGKYYSHTPCILIKIVALEDNNVKEKLEKLSDKISSLK